jgi:signal peptidase I
MKDNVYVVEQNYYFVLGDNRGNSEDSRYLGFVSGKDIIGAPLLIYWSWDSSIPYSSPLKLLGSIRWERFMTVVK